MEMKIKINDINDLTIKQYLELLNLFENSEEGDIDRVKIVEIITDKTREDLKDIKISIVNELVDSIITLFDEKPRTDDLGDFKIDGVEYTFDMDLSKMKTGMFVDLYNYTNNQDLINDIHIIAAILWRPRGLLKIEDYDSEKVLDRAKIFYEKMTISKCFSSSVFFWNLREEFFNHIEEFSEEEKMKV